MRIPKFGINRQDAESVARFTTDAARIEELGWDCVWLPDSQLRRRDTYVLLAAAAQATESIQLGTLLVNPVTRHPSVTASSIATVEELAPDRVALGFGAGDTAVRLSGLRPARVAEMEDAIVLMRSLLAGERVEVGAERPSYLPFHRPVPVWLTAGGPRTLEMGGRVADGVFMRVGTHQATIADTVAKIRRGAEDAGRDPLSIPLGIIFHTVLVDDPDEALLMGKAMAAGYYEYSPMLFEPPGLRWDGPDPEALKHERGVWPDFHHDPDLLKAGRAVDFLNESHADAFSLHGTAKQVAEQLVSVLAEAARNGIEFEHVVLHPIPNPPAPDDASDGYTVRVAQEILPWVRERLASMS
ncbi:MAG: LLM class flavin-dependent oxidoreductase [Chloroflexi bacterium]|nr:LLM class flavin-dependent oxidoreductase [Chloroflexota bacterium]MYF23097.1 LLM class flavin-dependent oxidoreductase [Chloroflexota bacterium]